MITKIKRTFDEIKNVLVPIKASKDEFLTICPFCESDEGSGHLSIKRDGEDFIANCLKCGASNEELIRYFFPLDNTKEELQKLKAERRRIASERKKQAKVIKDKYEMRLIDNYQYKDINGNVLFSKQKFNYIDKASGEVLLKSSGKIKKAFKVVDSEGNPGMPKDYTGKPLVNIYNLDNLAIAPVGSNVFIVEGEKDVETLKLLGQVAISTYAGAGKCKRTFWTDVERDLLKAHRGNLVIIPDNDEAGEEYVNMWKEFNPIVFRLSDVWEEIEESSDISDYLEKSGKGFEFILGKITALKERKDILPITFKKDDEVLYNIEKDGIWKETTDPKDKKRTIKICNQPIVVEKAYYDEEEENLFYVLKYWFMKKWNEIIVNSRVLKNQQKVSAFDGRLEITSNNAKAMVDFFDSYIGYFDIKEENCELITNKLYIDSENKFVGFGSKIKFNNDLSKAFEPAGTWEKWHEAASDIWQHGSKVEAFEFAKLGISICTYIMKDLTPIFECVGKTGIGKTVLLQERISFYGNPAKGAGIFASGDTTLKALDKLLETTGFLPAEIDEGELLRNSKELNSDEGLNNLIYSLSEGISRSRLRKDRSTDEYVLNEKKSWNTIVNLTSESSLLRDTSGKGIVNRVMTIPVTKADITLKHYQTFMDNYGWFIRKLEAGGYFKKDLIKKYISDNRIFLSVEGYSDIASKQQGIFKYLSYTLNVFNMILGECQFKAEDFIEFFRKETDLDMTEKYINDVYSLIYSRQQKFFNKTDPELQLKTISTGDVWGVVTENYYFVDRTKLEQFFNTKYRIAFKSIADDFESKGVIKKYKNGKNRTTLSKRYEYNDFSFNAIRIVKKPLGTERIDD